MGNPLKFILTAGQRNYITYAVSLLKDFNNTNVIADKEYDVITENESEPVIPPKKNSKIQREYNVHLYKERHVGECFFGKIPHFKRVFSRFDKTAEDFIGFLKFVSVFVSLL